MNAKIRCIACKRYNALLEAKTGKPYFNCECGTQVFFRLQEAIDALEARLLDENDDGLILEEE